MSFAVGIVHYRDPGAVNDLLKHIDGWSVRPSFVIVVDNSGDLDASALFGPAGDNEVRVLPAGSNVGYAAAANIALREVWSAGLSAMLLLTQDARISSATVEKLLDEFGRDDRIGAIAPLLEFASRPGITFSKGGFLERTGRFNHNDALKPIEQVAGRGTVEVDWVDGACVLMRVDAALQVGMIPEEYFLYVEDVEFGLLLRRAGWRVCVDTEVIAAQEPGNFTDYFRSRNLLHLLLKHQDTFRTSAVVVLLMKELVRAAQRGTFAGVLWTVRGDLDAWRNRMGPPPKSLLAR